MRVRRVLVPMATVILALLAPSCASGANTTGESEGTSAAAVEAASPTTAPLASTPTGEHTELQASVVDEPEEMPTDPVPGALARMKPWPGLASAVTAVVMNSPKGRIHGHDAERIELDVDDAGAAARVRFIMRSSFTLHGDRTVGCLRRGEEWSCEDLSEAR